MTLCSRSTVQFPLRALLRWVLVLASGVGLDLASAKPALLAEPAASPPMSAVSASPHAAPSALEEARAAKRAAASYQTAGALSDAAASWAQSAQAYERAGNYGEAALAWTEVASLREQQNEPHAQVLKEHVRYLVFTEGLAHEIVTAFSQYAFAFVLKGAGR